MSEDLEAIKLLIKMKELGITQLEIEATKKMMIETKQEVAELSAEDIVKPMSVLDDLSEDEIQYYATPYYDELQAKKELQKQKVKEQE